MKKEENKGITLMALVITIGVLIILASITIKYGGESIKQAKIQNMKTNMLLIEAKTKEFVENGSVKRWLERLVEIDNSTVSFEGYMNPSEI